MRYIQARGAVFERHIADDAENVEWDAAHFCSIQRMTHDERVLFGIHPLVLVTPPSYDRLTQGLREVAPINTGDIAPVWTQAWEVYPLPAEEVSANIAAAQAALKRSISDAVQKRLDDFAATRGYGDDRTAPIVSACSYATSNHAKYGVEGRYCVQAREETWDAVYVIEAEVAAGHLPVPASYADIEHLLPTLTWPE